MIRMTTVKSQRPLHYQRCLTPHLKCIEERDDDDHHDDDDESDDCDDNHDEDDKDDHSHDNYHCRILCITKAADCHDSYHCSIVCFSNAAISEIMMTIRTMMIRMTTLSQHPLHYQWLYRRKR